MLWPIFRAEIKLFQRFKTEWEYINQEKFEENDLDLDPETKNEIISFCQNKNEISTKTAPSTR